MAKRLARFPFAKLERAGYAVLENGRVYVLLRNGSPIADHATAERAWRAALRHAKHYKLLPV